MDPAKSSSRRAKRPLFRAFFRYGAQRNQLDRSNRSPFTRDSLATLNLSCIIERLDPLRTCSRDGCLFKQRSPIIADVRIRNCTSILESLVNMRSLYSTTCYGASTCFRTTSDFNETTSARAAASHDLLQEHLLRRPAEIREETALVQSTVSMQLMHLLVGALVDTRIYTHRFHKLRIQSSSNNQLLSILLLRVIINP